MTKNVAIALVKKIEENGRDASIYEGYSGRGMFGDKTTGVVTCEGRSIVMLMAMEIVYELGLRDGDSENMTPPKYDFQKNDIVEDMTEMREDNMGKYDKIYY